MSRGIVAACLLVGGVSACTGGAPKDLSAAMAASDAPVGRLKASPSAEGFGPEAGIAARINDEIITWYDVEASLSKVKPKDRTPKLLRDQLRRLAEKRLFLQAARKYHLTVREQELDDTLKSEIRRAGGEENFQTHIRLRTMTRNEYREHLREELLEIKLHRHLIQKAWLDPDSGTPPPQIDTVSPQEIRKYYEDHPEQFKAIEHVTAWRIAIQYASDREREIRRETAQTAIEKLKENADFSILAHFYNPPGTSHLRGATRENALEFFEKRSTVEYLFDKMKVGETSPIIEDGRTFNIFRMEQHVNQREESFEEAQAKIRPPLESRRRKENRDRLRDFLVEESLVIPAGLFDKP